MNFMSYVAEVSRGWDEPNARNMGRMTSQPKAKGEMYILNDGINMKAEIAAMERRLEKLEMTNMQPVQAISQTPLQAMPCAICLSYEHLVDECPTIPAEREMFGDCNTYNSNWRDHPNFSWKPQPPQYQQPAQAPQQPPNLEQVMVNLCKVMGDFVGKQEATNARVDQRIDRVESTLNKRMDEMQNDLSQKLDILHDSISRLANLNTVQEKENSPSQPYQNSKGIHEVEAPEGESSMVKEVEEVITLRSGKEVDLPTCKLEHKVESETEKEKREEIKGKKKGKSTEKDDYIDEEPQRIVIKEELMKKHMPPPFLQAIGIAKKLKKKNRSKIGVKRRKNRGKTRVCEISQPLRNRHFAAKPVRSLRPLSAKIFAAAKITFGTRVPLRSTGTPISQLRNGCEAPKHEKSHFRRESSIWKRIWQLRNQLLAHECHFAAQEHPFGSCETHCEVVKPDFAPKVPFHREFRGCETNLWHTSATSQHSDPHFAAAKWLRNGCEIPKCEKSQFHSRTPFRQLFDTFRSLTEVQIMRAISRLKAWEPFAKFVQSMQGKNNGEEEKQSEEDKGKLAVVFFCTFGVLPEVHFLHSIYHFKAQEVKNPMLQTVRDSELKRRSYSHCKSITLKCCEISLLLREFRSLFVQCYGIPPEATRYMPQAGTLRTSRWKPISQPCEFNLLLRKYFAALLGVCEISQTPFSPAKCP
uniref:Retrotransposon gag domain-containing protein n=1 Tax=Vitis vinifera TaxID=29760 RepID=A5AG00_VITVI|nr:hypothetical protein VITISV_026063 [Vitis vinifera]